LSGFPICQEPLQHSRQIVTVELISGENLRLDLVPLDEKCQLFISPSIDDWKSIEDQGITAVIDLDGDLDLGIPNIPNHMLYVLLSHLSMRACRI